MNNISRKYLLQIEPKNKKSELPVNDFLTKKMESLLESAIRGRGYKGRHKCVCGEKSGNYDLEVRGYITNSLATHYLRWHRWEVPISEIEKLREI